MNDDLHDIDDLFRNGLEGHEEDVPSAVWQAVSNDLDKKQASYYKQKYRRLKRAAWLLLLLCVSGGAYVVFHTVHDNKPTVMKEQPEAHAPAAPLSVGKEQNKTVDEKKAGRVDEPVTQEEDLTVENNSTVNESVISLRKQQTKAGTSDPKEYASVNKDFVFRSSSTLGNKQDNHSFLLEKSVSQKNRLNSNRDNPEQPSSFAAPEKFLLDFSPFPVKEFKLPVTNPEPLTGMPLFILPQQKKGSALKTKSTHGFSLSAFAAPNISFDRLEDDDHLAGPGRNRGDAHRYEQENISFSGGLLLNYELTKNLSLQSGVSVLSSSTSIAPKTVYAEADNNGHTHYELHCSSGYVYISPKTGVQPAAGDSAITSGTTSKLTYVSIPAAISYRIPAGRFSLLPTIGFGVNILTSGKAKTNLSNGTSDEGTTTTSISGLKPSYVDGHLGFGIEYGLNQKLSIGIRPNARLALTPINRETPVKSYQNFLSVEAGVRVRL
jgi:hypothetical protein